jgi:hypothetical protein
MLRHTFANFDPVAQTGTTGSSTALRSINAGYLLTHGDAPDQRLARMNDWMCPPWVLKRLSATEEG